MSIHVLFPVDDSAYSKAAGKLALQIAKAQPSRVTALRVVNVRPASGNILEDITGHLGFEPAIVPADVAKQRDDAATALEAAWAREARDQGVQADGVVEVGVVANTILKHADPADLVVMGLRGETEERFPRQGGAMGGWLPQRVETPILWATPGADHISAIAVGYDGSEAAKRGIRVIRHLLAPLGVPIHAIYLSVDGSGGEILDEVEDALPGCAIVKHVVKAQPSHDTLVAQAEAVGATVLVLGFRGKSPLKDFLFGTSTERVLLGGKLAVLVAR